MRNILYHSETDERSLKARLPAGDELLVPALSGDGFRDRPPLNLKSIPMKAADPVTNWWPASSRGQIRISTQCYIGTNTSVRGKAGTPGNMSVHQFCPVALEKVMQWSPNENLSNGRKPQLIGFLPKWAANFSCSSDAWAGWSAATFAISKITKRRQQLIEIQWRCQVSQLVVVVWWR